MISTQFTAWPRFSQEEADAVSRVLLSNKVNYWTGNEARKFEREYAQFADCQHAVAVFNGTVALDLALKALGVGIGDEVVVTPRTFIASVSSVVTCGATPVFADVDEHTQGISAQTIEQVLTSNTKAVIVVHLGGAPADMDPIMDLANKHNLKVIEDCAQAHGARYKGKSVGSIGHIGTWSFCQDKIMSTGGEGGMVTTNNKDLWSTMWSYKDHGKSWEAVYEKDHPPGYRWLHESFGTNWRMTEIQATIGRIQLGRMPDWHARRVANFQRVFDACAKCDWIRMPDIKYEHEHAAYKAYGFVNTNMLPNQWNRDTVMDAIAKQDIPVFSGSCSEVYREKAFDNTGWRPDSALPVARKLGEESIMFLVHPTLTDAEVSKTCDAISAVNQTIVSERETRHQA